MYLLKNRFTNAQPACKLKLNFNHRIDQLMPEVEAILKDVDVEFISLVDSPANNKEIIYKSDSGEQINTQHTAQIKKVDEDKQLVYGIVYAPKEVDSYGHTMSAAEVEKMQRNFMKKARNGNIDKQHDQQPDEGYLAESWLVKKNDPVFPQEKAGSWAVALKVQDEDTWEEIKNEEITGISLGGRGKVVPVDEANEDELEAAGVEKRSQVGTFIANLRDAEGLTNADLAEAAGRSVSTINSLISGQISGRGVSDEVWQNLAEALGTNTKSLKAQVMDKSKQEKQDKEEKSFLQRVKDLIPNFSLEKNFNERLQNSQLKFAVQIYQRELDHIIYEMPESQQINLLNEATQQFSNYINNLESVQAMKNDKKEKQEKSEENEQTLEQRVEKLEDTIQGIDEKLDKAIGSSEDEETEEQEQEKNDNDEEVTKQDLLERIEQLENSGNGRQSTKGQEEKQEKNKSKGLSFATG